MKTVLCISLLTLVSMQALGGSEKVDSLKQLLEQHTTTDKAEVLWSIAYELFDVDNAQALFYAERAYHDVWKRGDSLQIVKVGTTYGQLLRRMGKVDQAIEISSKMLPIAKRHEYKKYWKMLLNSLAVSFINGEDFANALDKLYELKDFVEAADDQEGLLLTLSNISLLMYKLDDFDQAIAIGLQSLRLSQQMGHKRYHASALTNIGAAHMGLKNYDSAVYYTLQALEEAKTYHGELVSQNFQQLALSHLELGNYDSAAHYANQGVEKAQTEGHAWSLAFCNIHLSRIALLQNRKRESKVYLDRATNLAQTTDFPLLELEVLRQTGRYQAAMGKLDSAMSALDRFLVLSDSLYSGKKSVVIRQVQVKYDERENRKRIALQSNLLGVQQEYLNQQRILIFVVTSFLFIVSLLSFALYRSYRMMKLINRQLDQRVMDRTKELSKHRDALQHLIDEENGRRSRATAELMGMFSSLRGLLHLAKVDPGKREDDYLEKALGLTVQMESVSQKYNEQTQRKPQIPGT